MRCFLSFTGFLSTPKSSAIHFLLHYCLLYFISLLSKNIPKNFSNLHSTALASPFIGFLSRNIPKFLAIHILLHCFLLYFITLRCRNIPESPAIHILLHCFRPLISLLEISKVFRESTFYCSVFLCSLVSFLKNTPKSSTTHILQQCFPSFVFVPSGNC